MDKSSIWTTAIFLTFTAVDSTNNQFLLYTDYSKCICLYLLEIEKGNETQQTTDLMKLDFPFLPDDQIIITSNICLVVAVLISFFRH